MLGWMIYEKESAKKNERYIKFYQEEGKKRGIEIKVLYVEEIQFGVDGYRWYLLYQNREVKLPDFAVCRTIYPLISSQLEQLGVPVFNNSTVARICNDKALTYQEIAKLQIPMIKTQFCKAHELDACLANRNYTTPMVFKAVAGHGGGQVYLYDITSKDCGAKAKEIKEGLFGCDFVLQPLTGKRHQDLRAYVIGKEIVAAVLRTAKEGFKSNFSLGGEVRQYQLSEEQRKMIQRIVDSFHFGLVGIDFLIGDEDDLIFNEIEDVVGARMLYQSCDYNLVGNYLDYIKDEVNRLIM